MWNVTTNNDAYYFQVSYTSSACNYKMFEPVKSTGYTIIKQSDNDLKEEGNRLFSIKRYAKAIECYSMAIVSKIYIITLSFEP